MMSKLIAVLFATCMLIGMAAAQAEDMKDMNMPAKADMSKDDMKKGSMTKHHHMKKHMMKKDEMSKDEMK
jgi:hypothetical protein